MKVLVALKRAAWVLVGEGYSVLEAGIFGDSFGSLKDSLLGQLSWQEKCQGSLDLPGGDGGPLVVVGKTAGLISGSQSPSSPPSSSKVEKVGVVVKRMSWRVQLIPITQASVYIHTGENSHPIGRKKRRSLCQ